MISREERSRLWNEFSGGKLFATERLEELSRASVNELEEQIRCMIQGGKFSGGLTAHAIAYEIRHEALRLLTQRRQCETGPLPQMARAFQRIQ